MDDLRKITEHLEYLFLRKIVEGLRDRSISIPDAKRYASTFRSLEPFTSLDDAKTKMSKYSEENKPFQHLKEYTNAFHSEQKIGAVIEKMRGFIQTNQIDEALQVAQNHN